MRAHRSIGRPLRLAEDTIHPPIRRPARAEWLPELGLMLLVSGCLMLLALVGLMRLWGVL